MSQIVTNTLVIRLRPRRHWFSLGPGWATLGALLASGVLVFETGFWQTNAAILVKMGLLWVLVDPILGTIWHALVEQGWWRQVWRESRESGLAVTPVVPYTSRGSMGYRLSAVAAVLHARHGGTWPTLLLLTLAALILGGLLGLIPLAMVIFSIGLAVFIGQRDAKLSLWALLGQSICGFLLPFLIGLWLTGYTGREAFLFGVGYWAVYLGSLRMLADQPGGDRLIVAAQAAVALLLFALVKPLAATAVALSAVFSVLLRLDTAHKSDAVHKNDAVRQDDTVRQDDKVLWSEFALRAHPFLLIGFLVSSAILGA